MSIKVLVADDSITIQKVIGIIFGGDEYSLTVVDNGKAAVDKAREINPDVLLIDVLMPGMTGYEVAEMIRSTPSLTTKPILLLTGSFEPFDEEKAKKCGADDFIAKPFESQQIITKVKELLELGNSRANATPAAVAQQAPEVTPPQATEAPATVFGAPVSGFSAQAEATIPAEAPAPADIWGAFTPEIEVPVVNQVAPPVVASAPPSPAIDLEPDVFAIISEENDSQIVQTATQSVSSPQHTGSQWIPVEENTFEFEDESIVDPPSSAFTEQPVPTVPDVSFGEIAFEDDETTSAPPVAPVFAAVIPETTFAAVPEQPLPVAPVVEAPEIAFEAPKAAPSETFAPLVDPTTTVAVSTVAPEVIAAPQQLTEEQLKAALAGVSKDVIERIVWEIVPDLAEALIREAIRKIKEGI